MRQEDSDNNEEFVKKVADSTPRLCLLGTERQEIGINAGLKVGEVLVSLSYSTILFVGFSRGLALFHARKPVFDLFSLRAA